MRTIPGGLNVLGVLEKSQLSPELLVRYHFLRYMYEYYMPAPCVF